jgi:hypothetical protein
MRDFKLFFAVSSLASCLAAGAERPGALLERVEAALDRGFTSEAESLFAEVRKMPGGGVPRHRREIAGARLAAARGDWRGADARLEAWKRDPARGEGSGEILFWQGWSALHQGRRERADSLFVLAGAYAGQPGSTRAQEALEYRFAALLDASPLLTEYLRGLPESPLPDSLRLAALARVTSASRLRPEAQWQLALLHQLRGDSLEARATLSALAADPSTLAGRRAAARLNRAREDAAPDSAQRGYEALLLRQQQGVPSEFARKRLQELRGNP